jgi:hypothetical protein
MYTQKAVSKREAFRVVLKGIEGCFGGVFVTVNNKVKQNLNEKDALRSQKE